MSIFNPRLNYNGTNTLDYYTTANPFYTAQEWGYNPATGQDEWLSLWMPNCTAYAFGRFNELAQEHQYNTRWPMGNGEDWYDLAPGLGLSRGQTPSIGAAMCWSYTDGSEGGHVAIIEQLIYTGNTLTEIVTSNSAWNGYNPPRTPQNSFPWFYLEHIDPNYLDNYSNQHFKGFIYHPNYPAGSSSLKLPDFISLLAKSGSNKNILVLKRRPKIWGK